MKNSFVLILFAGFLMIASLSCDAQDTNEDKRFKASPNFAIKGVKVQYLQDLELMIFSITVDGQAGKSTPRAIGKMDGAPVVGYVFPTTLQSSDVGFSATEGIVALALTSHPDFDDTPLWDENADRKFDNDGLIWHPHWVILQEDERVSGGLAVKEFDQKDATVKLPPTNPGMPMYMDSPGFQVVTKGPDIKVIVPAYRMSNKTDFHYDGVSVYMEVNASDKDRPMLGVYNVYSVASGDLSLPFTVDQTH